MKTFIRNTTLFFIIFISTTDVHTQILVKSWSKICETEEGPWFASKEAIEIAENVLLYQREIGGWPKNIQMHLPLTDQEKEALLLLQSSTSDCTADNGATVQEMLYLSKMYRQVNDDRYKKAFLNGLDYLLEAQYENGGWPQFYPLKKGYYTHITFNDDLMVNILNLLQALKDKPDYYSIVLNDEMLQRVNKAFEKGIDCILKTQYIQNGILTAWCAQHDEKSYEPVQARAFELPSLSGKESAQIVLLLMSIKDPSDEIKNAVTHAVDWFEKVKITGVKIEKVKNEEGKVVDMLVVFDDTAPPVWARFMNLDDNIPFFCDRDGIKKATLAEIGLERRTGYAWYTNEPKEVLKKYPKWKEQHMSIVPEKKN